MSASGFTLFETLIGRCGLAWTGGQVAAVQLPEANDDETRASLCRRVPAARERKPSPDIQRAIDSIVSLLRGEASDLSTIPLDLDRVPPFHRRVYDLAQTIPPGETLSYGDVAARLGTPGGARAVGQALRRNPFAIVVPCHRVLAAGGKVGGFTANGGISTKLRLLSIEGASAAVSGRALFENDGAFGFDPTVAVAHLRSKDTKLARLIDTVGPFGMQINRTPDLFIALAEAIVYQQLTAKAAATIFARVRALFPRAHLAPTPQQILHATDDKLRAAGLSRSKLLSLRDLAQRTADGSLPTLAELQKMDDEAIVQRLTAVRGIGRWTVEMLLMFRFGRPDILPLDDYGIRKGFGHIFTKGALPTRAEMEKRAARWKPYCTVASWYLWRAAERAKK